ncbi:hypothetical protein ABT187_48760 [Streptomyces sp. NPDC001817]|uniref:hypothetical protein n=1 Tax=Streptomyces sp. NPDC001817 TaxID=3154398 RepID=UPI0033254F7B
MLKSSLFAKALAVAGATAVLTLSGGTAMAAEPAAAAPHSAVTEVTQPEAVGYTFDHDTTVQIYQMAVEGSQDAVTALCEAIVPDPVGSVVCPALASGVSKLIGLGAPGADDRLYVGVQFGWPPILIHYV